MICTKYEVYNNSQFIISMIFGYVNISTVVFALNFYHFALYLQFTFAGARVSASISDMVGKIV